jgi:hypothetical protein
MLVMGYAAACTAAFVLQGCTAATGVAAVNAFTAAHGIHGRLAAALKKFLLKHAGKQLFSTTA